MPLKAIRITKVMMISLIPIFPFIFHKKKRVIGIARIMLIIAHLFVALLKVLIIKCFILIYKTGNYVLELDRNNRLIVLILRFPNI